MKKRGAKIKRRTASKIYNILVVELNKTSRSTVVVSLYRNHFQNGSKIMDRSEKIIADLKILRFTMDIITMLLHMIGIYLLRKVKCSRTFTPVQLFYFIQLSAVEIVFAIMSSLIYVVDSLAPESKVLDYLHAVKSLPTFLLYIGTMLLITGDRFMLVYYNLRYNSIWTNRRAYLAGFVILTCSLSSLTLYFTIDNKTYQYICAVYIYPGFDALFICVATLTYIYFFKKIKEHRNDRIKYFNRRCRNQAQNENNTRPMARIKNGFYMPTLLIVSFIIFAVAPDVVYFIAVIQQSNMGATGLYFSIFYRVGLAWDAVIYVFFQKEVRNVLKSIAKKCYKRFKNV